MIQIEHLTKVFDTRDGDHAALKDVSLTIEDGDIFGIIGQSGAGKSTLVRCINLLERPTSGTITIDGKDITNYQGKQLLNLREGIGMIFQNFSLFQQRTVLRNVTFPLELRHEKKAVREARARELLEVVGLSGYESRYPSELSGGQQQRVAIARALANDPKIMLCDEATSALDTRTTVSILSLLKEINQTLGVTLVVITHSLTVAQKICNRIAVIDYGQVVEEGFTDQVFSHPQSPVTRELIENDSLTALDRVDEGTPAGEGSGLDSGEDAEPGDDASSGAASDDGDGSGLAAASELDSAHAQSGDQGNNLHEEAHK